MRMEREPVQFFVAELEPLLDEARTALARFVGAPVEGLVPVANATHGINAVLRSLTFQRGDEILVTNQEYNASRNAAEYAAGRAGAKVVVAPVPFPLESPEQVVAAILDKVTRRTRLAMVDHVTSQTGLVYPMARIAAELAKCGVELLVDGAHAPGMIPLNLRKLGATYYTGNCHKWICAPKGAAFLYVAPERRAEIRPLSISHGANSPRTDRARFLIEFGWTGTADFSAFLCIPKALETIGGLLPGGWRDVRAHNRALVLAGRRILCEALKISAPAPEEMIGSLASVPIPEKPRGTKRKPPLFAFFDPLQDALFRKHKIEVPIIHWPASPKRVLRISAQLYNSVPQYERLAQALVEELGKGE